MYVNLDCIDGKQVSDSDGNAQVLLEAETFTHLEQTKRREGGEKKRQHDSSMTLFEVTRNVHTYIAKILVNHRAADGTIPPLMAFFYLLYTSPFYCSK